MSLIMSNHDLKDLIKYFRFITNSLGNKYIIGSADIYMHNFRHSKIDKNRM